MDYEDPTGDFEVMTTQSQPGQRRTITYGAYMTLGRPKLSFRTVKISSNLPTTHNTLNDAARSIQSDPTVDPSEQQQQGGTTVHDPQQPPPVAGSVIVQQVHQRHPQQPPEPQNPHAEQGLNGEILPVLGNRAQDGTLCTTSGHGSNLAPQIGAPALQSGTPTGKGSYSLEFLTVQHVYGVVRGWWKHVVVVIGAFLLVIMIINVAAFQETGSTSLDLVTMPAWSRPFVIMRRYWTSDSRTSSSSSSASSPPLGSQDTWDSWDRGFEDMAEEVDAEKTATVTATIKQADPQTTVEASYTRDLEILPRAGPRKLNDDGNGEDGGIQKPRGLMKFIQTLKNIVQGLKAQ